MSKILNTLILILLVGGCARDPSLVYESNGSVTLTTPHLQIEANLTGGTDSDGVPFTAGNDPRVDALKEELSKTDLNHQLEVLSLIASISDLTVNRDEKHFLITFKITEKNSSKTIKFEGDYQLTGEQKIIPDTFATNDPKYKLSGSIATAIENGTGELQLTLGEARARILTRQYTANVRVRKERLDPGQSLSAKQKETLQKLTTAEESGAFVRNWVVVMGPSFYDVELRSKNGLLFSFSGEAKKTGDPGGRPVRAFIPGLMSPQEIAIWGESSTEDLRSFFVVFGTGTLDRVRALLELKKADMPTKFTPTRSQVSPPQPFKASKSFLPIPMDMNRLPNSTVSIQHLNSNLDIPEVQDWIAKWTQGNLRQEINNFTYYAKPFVSSIRTIFEAYDVASSFAYLTIVESIYFTGGKYQISANSSSSALGPFQLLYGTALGQDMQVYRSGRGARPEDERRYFVPSACGAANYLKTLTNLFVDSDATFAALAYHLGEGDSAAAIHCSYGLSDPAEQKRCGDKIGKARFKSSDYDRYLRQLDRFSFTYRDINSQGLINGQYLDYTNKFLALHFILMNPSSYGFDTRNGAENLPKDSFMPSFQIQSETCRKAIAPLLVGT